MQRVRDRTYLGEGNDRSLEESEKEIESHSRHEVGLGVQLVDHFGGDDKFVATMTGRAIQLASVVAIVRTAYTKDTRLEQVIAVGATVALLRHQLGCGRLERQQCSRK